MQHAVVESGRAGGGFARSCAGVVALVAGMLVVGVPFWATPYREVSLPSAIVGPGSYVVTLAALLLCAVAREWFWRAVAFAGAAMPLAVVARVAVETTIDPTTHNLFPFEVAIALGVGFAYAAPGAAAGDPEHAPVDRTVAGEPSRAAHAPTSARRSSVEKSSVMRRIQLACE